MGGYPGLRRGFTLVELLVVLGIIVVLASIVIVAINPTKQLGDARNTQRQADLNTILNAVYQYAIRNGALPAAISTTAKTICNTGASSCNNGVDLTVLTASGLYVVQLPADPQATGTGTNYAIVKNAAGRIKVTALGTEPAGSAPITATR